jgi:hypothetical protein
VIPLKQFVLPKKVWLLVRADYFFSNIVVSCLIFAVSVLIAKYVEGVQNTNMIPIEGVIWAALLSATLSHGVYAIVRHTNWRDREPGEGLLAGALGGAIPGIVAALVLASWPISIRILIAAISLSCSLGPFLVWKLLTKKRIEAWHRDL